MNETTKVTVRDYETAATVGRRASKELVEASEAAVPTGAVPAWRDERGVWQYVAPCDVEHCERHLGLSVRTVYID